ncbi:MAG: hypothetical protein H7Z41_04515 [Cytophagales bacterium]|nr:hypothetical protein [Armatimonadota bacterium]
MRSLHGFRSALRLSRRLRTTEEKFRDFLALGFDLRLSDYERMDKDLQAAVNDKFAYVFLRNPLEERIRQFLTSPARPVHCHAPGCEWRESELSGFGVLARRCVRCEHYQVRASHGTSVWQDVSRSDYEFLVVRDEAFRAQWDTAPTANVVFDTATVAGDNFDTATRR